jgi:peptidoglycan hydrolase FlgJ
MPDLAVPPPPNRHAAQLPAPRGITPPPDPSAGPSSLHSGLRAAAEALEASFLDEMLKGAGFGGARNAFGGGVGEDQFASFLRHEHAKALVTKGGIGLADSIFASLVRHAA